MTADWLAACLAAVATAFIIVELMATQPRLADKAPRNRPAPNDLPLVHSGEGFML